MLARVLATALCLCLSVCLSQVGVVSKRLDKSGWFWHGSFLGRRRSTKLIIPPSCDARPQQFIAQWVKLRLYSAILSRGSISYGWYTCMNRMWRMMYIEWQWRNFVPYLCQLRFRRHLLGETLSNVCYSAVTEITVVSRLMIMWTFP